MDSYKQHSMVLVTYYIKSENSSCTFCFFSAVDNSNSMLMKTNRVNPKTNPTLLHVLPEQSVSGITVLRRRVYVARGTSQVDVYK